MNKTTLPLSVIGEDLGFFQNNIGLWDDQKLNRLTELGCNGLRLAFVFSSMSNDWACSTYSESKVNEVLYKLDSVGVKAVLACFNTGPALGSSTLVNEWKTLAQSFKGDSRIAAYGLLNECWSFRSGSVTNVTQWHQAIAELIKAIRDIDPDRTIMYPTLAGFVKSYGYPFNFAEFKQGAANALANKELDLSNIYWDIYHPYFWEKPAGVMNNYENPIDEADWINDQILIPANNAFGRGKCWIGETFPFSSSEGYTTNIQEAFVTRLLTRCVQQNVGVQLMWYWSRQKDHNYSSYDTVIANSTYLQTLTAAAPEPEPVPEPTPEPEPEPVECNVAEDCAAKFGHAASGFHWECINNKCDQVEDVVIIPPIGPNPEPLKWCIFAEATEGTVMVGYLPLIRVFRDNCLPKRIIHDYYWVSSYIAPEIHKFRKWIKRQSL